MEVLPDGESQLMIEESVPETLPIDPKSARFPCCIVWTTLPVISWLIPFIGHIGICREDGVILDFAGPNYVCVDNFAFGAVTRYLQISKDKCCISCHRSTRKREGQYSHNELDKDILTWDGVLRKSTQEFQHRSYSLLTCNCHSFVANNLNRLGFRSGGWNVVNLALLIFFKARWVSKTSIVLSFLPFGIILSLGLAFGGMKFLTYLAAFAFVLIGWFLIGTYCFKSLIQL